MCNSTDLTLLSFKRLLGKLIKHRLLITLTRLPRNRHPTGINASTIWEMSGQVLKWLLRGESQWINQLWWIKEKGHSGEHTPLGFWFIRRVEVKALLITDRLPWDPSALSDASSAYWSDTALTVAPRSTNVAYSFTKLEVHFPSRDLH